MRFSMARENESKVSNIHDHRRIYSTWYADSIYKSLIIAWRVPLVFGREGALTTRQAS